MQFLSNFASVTAFFIFWVKKTMKLLTTVKKMLVYFLKKIKIKINCNAEKVEQNYVYCYETIIPEITPPPFPASMDPLSGT
jgi:hypothetical protein